MENSKKSKVPCPNCKGNGYVRVPYELAKEEVIVQCGVCESQGEVNEDEIDNIIIDSDGCLLYTSPSPRDVEESRMPSSA